MLLILFIKSHPPPHNTLPPPQKDQLNSTRISEGHQRGQNDWAPRRPRRISVGSWCLVHLLQLRFSSQGSERDFTCIAKWLWNRPSGIFLAPSRQLCSYKSDAFTELTFQQRTTFRNHFFSSSAMVERTELRSSSSMANSLSSKPSCGPYSTQVLMKEVSCVKTLLI